MSRHFSVRVDELNEGHDKLALLAWVKKMNPIRCIVSQEISKEVKKVHYHMYLNVDLVHDKRSVRNQFDYVFRKTHKGSTRSLAEVKKLNSFLSYIVKDTKIIHTIGFTEGDIKLIPKWVEGKKDGGPKIVSILNAYVPPEVRKKRDIAGYIIRYYRENEKPLMMYAVRGYLNTIHLIRNAEDSEITDEYIERLCS